MHLDLETGAMKKREKKFETSADVEFELFSGRMWPPIDTLTSQLEIKRANVSGTYPDGNAKPTPSDPPEPEAIRVLKPINSPASLMIAPPELPRLIAASV